MRNPEKTRQIIVEKSAELFNVNGIAGTSMDMIIKETGYKKGGIYNHFKSKEELAIASFWHAYELIKHQFILSFPENARASERLIAYVRTYKSFIAKSPMKGGCPILNFAIEADDAHPTIAQEVKKAVMDWLEILKGMFEEVKLDFPETNPEKEANFIMSAIEGAIMIAKIRKDGKVLLDTADQLEAYLNSKFSS